MEIVREIIRKADPEIRPFLAAAREAALAKDGPKTWDNVFRVGQTAYRAVPKDLQPALNPAVPGENAKITDVRYYIQTFTQAMQFENTEILEMLRRGSWDEVVNSIDQMKAFLDVFVSLEGAANTTRVLGLSKKGLSIFDPLLQATITAFLTGETGLVQEQKEKAKAKAGLGGRHKTRRTKRTRKH